MTTKVGVENISTMEGTGVRVTNKASNTGSDRHHVIARVIGDSQPSSFSDTNLAPGHSGDFSLFAGMKVELHEGELAEEAAAGDQSGESGGVDPDSRKRGEDPDAA